MTTRSGLTIWQSYGFRLPMVNFEDPKRGLVLIHFLNPSATEITKWRLRIKYGGGWRWK